VIIIIITTIRFILPCNIASVSTRTWLCAVCSLITAGGDADIPTVVKKLPASSALESSVQLVMETKLKIIEILQVGLVF